MSNQVFICDCNSTSKLDVATVKTGVTAGLGSSKSVAFQEVTQLCRREVAGFAKSCEGTDDVLVNCTQERATFEQIAQAKQVIAPIRFVNTREFAAWGTKDSEVNASAKAAALIAMGLSTPMDPVPTVSYQSQGRVAIIGPADRVMPWAERLQVSMNVVGVAIGKSAADKIGLVGKARGFPLSSASQISVTGWLGKFSLTWSAGAPIDLDACVRCDACVQACPEGAIDTWLNINLDACKSHRSCVSACDGVAAIDFSRADSQRSEQVDIVLDLRDTPGFEQHQPPQGYFYLAPDEANNVSKTMSLALQITGLVGEFEKPKFFAYKEKLCAHGRNEKVGCSACIDVCSAKAVSSSGDKVSVNPHLCVGCGACTTVCPSGAMTYQYPKVESIAGKLRSGLKAYFAAKGTTPTIAFFDEEQGFAAMQALGATTKSPGLASHVIPVGLRHIASSGIDTWLSALAYGAGQVVVVLNEHCAPQYQVALREQADLANTIIAAIGLGSDVVRVLAPEQITQLSVLPARAGVPVPATYAASDEKRRTVELALDHLIKQSGFEPQAPIALPKGAPFGKIEVNTKACTLCLACVGACPEAALADNQETPQLRFIERNCVQCGLCEKTCPENAISLGPQLDLRPSAKEMLMLNEAKPFHCVSCGKAFGTSAMIENMMSKLAGHSMFNEQTLGRLKMCADCRVVDMVKHQDKEKSIFDFTEQKRPK